MDKKTIIVASSNNGKINEIKNILSNYNILSVKEKGLSFEVEETGNSFYENALLKAQAVTSATGDIALADDSGLCVEALNGKPGIFSARYSNTGNSEKNIDLLLKNLENKKNRNAKFCCCIVVTFPDGKIISSFGETHGKILFSRQGNNGFGYDSVFFSNDLNKSFGLASQEEKNTVSHRARALNLIKEKLL